MHLARQSADPTARPAACHVQRLLLSLMEFL
jgi:hypothetical protein